MSGKLAGMFDASMDKAGEILNPEARDLWRAANNIRRNKEEIFGAPLIRKIAKDDPEVVANTPLAFSLQT